MSEAAWGPGGESLRGCFPARADLRPLITICGLSGQPSDLVYDATRGRVVLHIARIDRWYFTLSPPRTQSASATTMSQAVEIALTDMRQGSGAS
jgi:hypothetical protein